MLRTEPPASMVPSEGTVTVLSEGTVTVLSGRTVTVLSGGTVRQLPCTSLQMTMCSGGVTEGGFRDQVIQAPLLLL